MNPALLGNAIQHKRIALGLTQQQLADMAKLSRQSLNGIEHGTVNATLETLGRLMDVLGLALDVYDPEVGRQGQGHTDPRTMDAEGRKRQLHRRAHA